MKLVGYISKMIAKARCPVDYALPIGETLLSLNPLLGTKFSMRFTQNIQCISCGKAIKKSYQQGYCFPCTQKLARCDLCILKPERCHYHLGTCREADWGRDHCMIPHVVYLANTSGIKVGITRQSQIPTRWIDQGAVLALPLFEVMTRRISGLIEVMLAHYVSDKTHWQKMLQAESLYPQQMIFRLGGERSSNRSVYKIHDCCEKREANNTENSSAKGIEVDLLAEREQLLSKLHVELQEIQAQFSPQAIKILDPNLSKFIYPVLRVPSKITALSLESEKLIEGILLGIKGQYLIFDVGVLNIRKFSGYGVEVLSES